MGTLTQWLRQPQRVWLRRASFQIHLWTGIAIGLYVVVLSVTGSVLVYRNEIDVWLATPRAVFDENAKALDADGLRQAAARAYPGWEVTDVSPGRTTRGRGRAGGPGGAGAAGGRGGRAARPPDPTASITVQRGDEKKDRLFNPYTGEDLGPSTTDAQLAVLWLVRLHDEL